MGIILFQCKQQGSDMTPRVSLRTLLLTLELLAAVVALQYVAASPPARAGAVWLAHDAPPALSVPARVNANG